MLNLTQYLDPLFEKIGQILKANEKSSKFPQEQDNLSKALSLVSSEIYMKHNRLVELEKQLEELIEQVENSTGDDKSSAQSEYNKFYKLASLQINYINDRLLSQFDSPYFGKIIFDRKEDNNFPTSNITSYIGKQAYFDEETKRVIVTDWRAPIANLYYNYSGPTKEVSFKSPVGIQKGDLTKKLQLDISNGTLNNVYDQSTGNSTVDAFLLTNLKRRVGKKLQDIISTIQEEQNNIIREDIGKTTIVQGVAGSGKTTILLHKISYIAYNYKDKIKIDNSLVIAPNVLFLDYISDALNTLGVFGIQRNTYLLWGKSKLGWEDKYFISNKEDYFDIKSFKGSKEFIKTIKNYLKFWEDNLIENIPHQELKIVIKNRFTYLKSQFRSLSLIEALNLSLEYALQQQNYGKNFVSNYFNNQYEPYKIEAIRRYFKQECRSYNIYRKLFRDKLLDRFANINKEQLSKIYNYTAKTLNGREYKSEDLPPILLIENYLNGDDNKKYDYILIDEAQDISLFAIFTLFLYSKNGNVTITGDLAQSIIPPFQIKSWKEVIDLLNDDELSRGIGFTRPSISYHELKKCYRTTIEVIDYTRNFLHTVFGKNDLPFSPPEGVLRHGADVKEISTNDLKNSLSELINQFDKEGDSTTAILCQDYAHADKIYDMIKDFKSKRFIYNYEVSDYKSAVLVLPIEKAKGLEFDSVIVVDKDSKYFTPDREGKKILDAKLLYVAFTRTLHKLVVIK